MKKLYIIHLVVLTFLTLNLINLKNLTLIDWDEGVFALQAKWLASEGAEGKPFNFQTPPLYQLIIAVLFKFFGDKDWILPFISIICAAVGMYFTFFLGKALYNEATGLIASLLFISTEYFLFFSKSGLSDATFLLFFIAAIYFFYQGIQKNQSMQYLYCGLWTLLACYTKYTGPILFLIYLFIAIRKHKELSKFWFLFTIIIPILLLLPYCFIFVKIISIAGITQRHGKLLGINHLKFLFYLFRFSPLILICAILYRIKNKRDYFLLTIILIFFFILGFYYPYFRLALPLIPLFSIFAARFLYQFKKLKYYLMGLIFLINIVLGFNTLTYHSNIPPLIGSKVDTLCRMYETNYVLTLVPPNIVFYINGKILQPANSLPSQLRDNKFLKNCDFIEMGKNILLGEKQILFLYTSIFEEFESKIKSLKAKASHIELIEFIDAPVYYKDLFNPVRNKKQIYEIYFFEIAKLDSVSLNDLWQIALRPGASVVKK